MALENLQPKEVFTFFEKLSAQLSASVEIAE